MITAYLLLNGAMYLLFGVWCTIAPSQTAAALGLAWQNPSGRSEYLAVYGGLEIGWGLIFFISGLRPEMQRFGLILAMCFYIPTAIWRLTTFATISGIGRTTYILGSLEAIMAVTAVVLFLRR